MGFKPKINEIYYHRLKIALEDAKRQPILKNSQTYLKETGEEPAFAVVRLAVP
jgi:hypothetical protein